MSIDLSKQHSVFISYTHKDRDRVVPIASYLGSLGLRVWLDTKELAAGQSIVESISHAISQSDLYVVALSPDALSSAWVNHELNTALTFEITQGHPKVLPVIVGKVDVPAMIKSRLYVDLSGTLDAGKSSLRQAIHKNLPEFDVTESLPAEEKTKLSLGSVTFRLRAETDKYYGSAFGDDITKSDVEEEAAILLKRLRKKANGILLNFVAAAEMDFTTPYPKFPNGDVTEYTEDSGGDFVGTIRKEAVVNVEVLNPDEQKLNDLVSSKLASLGVSKVVYSFFVSPPIDNLSQIALQRLQDNHVILGWDPENGADVELPDDLTLSVAPTSERIRLGIETKYAFQFEKRAKEFSVREFIDWLIARKSKVG